MLVLTADVRDIEGVRSAVQDVLKHFGRLDILIANAGAITSFTPREDPLRDCPSPSPLFVVLGLTLHSLAPSAEQERS